MGNYKRALAFSFVAFLAASPAFASTLHIHDFGKSGYDKDTRFDTDDRNDRSDNKDKKKFTGYEIGNSSDRLCNPTDNRWPDNNDRNKGSDKISYSWQPFSAYREEHHDRNWPKISYPIYLSWLKQDKDHHDYNHRVDDDHDEDDHKWLERYYRDICDHKKDHDYDPSRHCDPKDPGQAPLPGTFFLFASAIGLTALFGFKRKKTNRTI